VQLKEPEANLIEIPYIENKKMIPARPKINIYQSSKNALLFLFKDSDGEDYDLSVYSSIKGRVLRQHDRKNAVLEFEPIITGNQLSHTFSPEETEATFPRSGYVIEFRFFSSEWIPLVVAEVVLNNAFKAGTVLNQSELIVTEEQVIVNMSETAELAALALDAATRAEEAAEEAEAAASGLNLPSIEDGDAAKILEVKEDETGFDLTPVNEAYLNSAFGKDIASEEYVDDKASLSPFIWANVKRFGAKGDGVTNDTAAIQTALDSLPDGGGVVYVPPGTYRVLNLSITTSGTHFTGDGFSSCLKLIDEPGTPSGGASVLRINKGGGEAPVVGVSVTHLNIDGNYPNVPARGESRFSSWEGIDPDNVTNLTVSHCFIHDVYGDAIDIDSTFEGATFRNPGAKILYNRIWNCFDALHFYAVDQALIQGNSIWDCDGEGIGLLSASKDVQILGNRVKNVGSVSDTAALRLVSCDGVLVQGNYIAESQSTSEAAILVAIVAARNVIIRGNDLRDGQSNGIAGSFLIAEGNKIENFPSSGIECQTSTSNPSPVERHYIKNNVLKNASSIQLRKTATVDGNICSSIFVVAAQPNEGTFVTNNIARAIVVNSANCIVAGNKTVGGTQCINVLAGADRCQVLNNWVENPDNNGIHVRLTTGVVVRGNFVTGVTHTARRAIEVNEGIDCTVQNNTLTGNTRGLRLTSSSVRAWVSGNRLYNNSSSDIEDESTEGNEAIINDNLVNGVLVRDGAA
jgi:hypothetical protein